VDDQGDPGRGAWLVFRVFLRLGLTSFGGPVAHIGYFREEFVIRRRWLGERSFADLVALCQFLPGPASSQFGMALGLVRAGYAGALAAWAGFTLPSAVALILFAIGIARFGDAVPAGVLHGLKVVAVAVVAQAVWGMARNLSTGAVKLAITLAAAAVVSFVVSPWTQVGVIVAAGIAGVLLLEPPALALHEPLSTGVSRRAGAAWLALFLVLLAGLPLAARLAPDPAIAMVDAFYRAGALVFGGGHVVLPLLQAEVVPRGWVDEQTFLAGYGAAQAVPGPLFTFAGFLGASMHGAPSGWIGGAIALVAIFAPAFLLVAGALPFWEALRHGARMQAALAGVNAAVVGLLLAALVHPVATSAIRDPGDVALAAVALVALMRWKLPPWLVVAACGAAGWLLDRLV
jgi:chromate transporter